MYFFCSLGVGECGPDKNYSATVRFRTDDWHGKAAMHCHILQHQDNGMMGFANIRPSNTSCNHNCSNDGCPKSTCTCFFQCPLDQQIGKL